jgi:hypothetical protein
MKPPTTSGQGDVLFFSPKLLRPQRLAEFSRSKNFTSTVAVHTVIAINHFPPAELKEPVTRNFVELKKSRPMADQADLTFNTLIEHDVYCTRLLSRRCKYLLIIILRALSFVSHTTWDVGPVNT